MGPNQEAETTDAIAPHTDLEKDAGAGYEEGNGCGDGCITNSR